MQFKLDIQGLPPDQERFREIYAASPGYLRRQAQEILQGVPGARAVISRQVWQEVEVIEQAPAPAPAPTPVAPLEPAHGQ